MKPLRRKQRDITIKLRDQMDDKARGYRNRAHRQADLKANRETMRTGRHALHEPERSDFNSYPASTNGPDT